MLSDAIGLLGVDIQDILIYSLVKVISNWIGHPIVKLDLEGHGREPIIKDVNITQTVGWFTSLYPVVINLISSTSVSDELISVKEQIRKIPSKGINFGVLRYLSSLDLGSGQVKAEISLNYLGQVNIDLNRGSIFKIANKSTGLSHSILANRSHLIDVIASVVDEKLLVEWQYNYAIHKKETIQNLFDNFHSFC